MHLLFNNQLLEEQTNMATGSACAALKRIQYVKKKYLTVFVMSCICSNAVFLT